MSTKKTYSLTMPEIQYPLADQNRGFSLEEVRDLIRNDDRFGYDDNSPDALEEIDGELWAKRAGGTGYRVRVAVSE